MTGTQFLTAAYDKTMEILVLLVLLMTLDKNSDLTAKLRSALTFYRENRELIQMVSTAAGMKPTGAEPAHAEPKRETRNEKESPAPQGTDSLKILEEYLKRTAV
jgi:hypothetical protein